jgi:hypothetical protein
MGCIESLAGLMSGGFLEFWGRAPAKGNVRFSAWCKLALSTLQRHSWRPVSASSPILRFTGAD